MNKIHWNTVSNRVGINTAHTLQAISSFYHENKVSDYFNNTKLLIGVGKRLNLRNRVLFLTCPFWEVESNKFAKDIPKPTYPKVQLPRRVQKFVDSGLKQLLNELKIDISCVLSTKEYLEIGKSIDEVDHQAIQENLLLIKSVSEFFSVRTMTQEEIELYRSILPDSHLNLRWHNDFHVFQELLAIRIAEKEEAVLAYMQMPRPMGERPFVLYKKCPMVAYRPLKK